MEGISNDKPKGIRASKRIKSSKKGDKSFQSGQNKINISKGDEQKNRKFIRRKARATIYLGHIPHGFYEDEMNSYFSQFGKVLSVTLARSEKTGRSKGYAFIEFLDEDVAKIAAETMNNYLMFNRILKCKYIPPEERNRRLKKIDQFNCPKLVNRKKEAEKKKTSLTKLDKETYLKKTQKKINKFKKFFEDRGIDFTLQLSNSDSQSDKKSKSSKNTSSTSLNVENETDDQVAVLEIDESDNEIHFKTPPQVKKVIKRSLDSPVAPSKRLCVKSNTKNSSKGISKLMSSSNETEEPKKTKKTIKSKLPSLKAPQVKTNKKSKVKLQSIGKSSKKKINKEKITSAGVRKTRVKARS